MLAPSELIQYLPAFQSFFFIVLFITMYREIKSARYILLFMTISFLSFLGEILANYMYYPVSVWSYYVTIPLQLTTLPLLFLYVASQTKINYRFSKIQFLHFLPAIAVLIINIITFTDIPQDIRVKLVEASLTKPEITNSLVFYIDTYNFSQNFIYNIQVIIYCFFLIKAVFSHRKKIENYFSNPENYKLKWLNFLVIMIAVFSLADIVAIYLTDLKSLNPEIYSLIVVLFISIIGYGGVWQKDIYRKADIVLPESESISEKSNINQNVKSEAEDFSDLALEIKNLVEGEKMYLNSGLNIDNISGRIGIHRNTISKCINEYYKQNFHQFINSYRIIHSQKLLKDPSQDNITIEGVALNSGFSSKSVFNPAFKEKVGVTPSEYRKARK